MALNNLTLVFTDQADPTNGRPTVCVTRADGTDDRWYYQQGGVTGWEMVASTLDAFEAARWWMFPLTPAEPAPQIMAAWLDANVPAATLTAVA